MTTYRVGHHQPRNLYRGDQYIGVMFDPIDTAAVARHLNMGLGECTCDSYEPCQGQCCGVGMCSCSTTEGEPQPGTPSAYRVYSQWFKAGDTSRRAVYNAIQAAYDAGCASSAPRGPLSAPVTAQEPTAVGQDRPDAHSGTEGRFWGEYPAHPTCIDVTNVRAGRPPGSEWMCGPDCPRQPERKADQA